MNLGSRQKKDAEQNQSFFDFSAIRRLFFLGISLIALGALQAQPGKDGTLTVSSGTRTVNRFALFLQASLPEAAALAWPMARS
jgi:hypothetical protein